MEAADESRFKIDLAAKEIALRRWVLPECLHVPVAAFDQQAIEDYVGTVERVLTHRLPARALLVRVKKPASADMRLPIWQVPSVGILHQPMQVWVDIGYGSYRTAYRRAFPTEDIDSKVLSHAMNRRTAALKGFQFVRLTPVSRSANSSSAFSEGWAVERHSAMTTVDERPRPTTSIQYADLTDLMLMLDMNLGGGVMEAVNLGQDLVRPRRSEEAGTAGDG